MNIEYKQHPYFEDIPLVFLDGRLMGDTANKFWHPTGEFERLTEGEQDDIIEQMIKDGRL